MVNLVSSEIDSTTYVFPHYFIGDTLVIDIETDEKDNFVGMAITKDGEQVEYITNISSEIKELLESASLVGHNVKGDMKWLKSWGVDIKSSQLYYDTCLASYVQNTTKESHNLKVLAKEYLGMQWSTYKEMVHPDPEHPNKKVTLDKQPIEKVAEYCGKDCLATYRLWKYFENKLTAQEKRYLQTIELPTARALFDMESAGVGIDVPYLEKLDFEFQNQLAEIEEQLEQQWQQLNKTTKLNVNSNRQVAELLIAQGARLPKTKKGAFQVNKQALSINSELPSVPLLLQHSKIEKLKSTYTEALLEKQKNGRIYCSFNQLTRGNNRQAVGISTGRLSSSDPNLQNIPVRTDEGKNIRRGFIADKEKTFIDVDFSQIEPRLVAHVSKDPLFMKAFIEDKDIYQELVDGTGRSRQDGKTFMLALLYGAQPEKLASVFGCSEQESKTILDSINKKLPNVNAWKYRVIYDAKRKGGVYTLFKRFVPLPGLFAENPYERMHWERVAVNTIIQGTAAEIMKLSLIALHKAGYKVVLTVHDEFLIEIDTHLVPDNVYEIKKILESIVTLDVPLKVDIGTGDDWMEAKQ